MNHRNHIHRPTGVYRTTAVQTAFVVALGLVWLTLPAAVAAQDVQGQIQAQAPTTLTVWEALNLVDTGHPVVAGLAARRSALDAERAGTTVLGVPSLTYAREGVEGSDYVEQRFVFGGSISPFTRASAQRATLAAERDAVGFDIDASRVELRASLKRAFIDVQYGDELVELRSNAVELASRLLEAARLREETGEASGFETLRAELEVERATAALKRAVRDRAEAGTMAKLSAGISGPTDEVDVASPGPMAFVPVVIQPTEAVGRLATQPDGMAASKRVEAARAGLRKERTALLPDLYVEVFPQDLGDGFNTYGFTVGLRLPALLWPATRPKLRAARAAIEEQQRAQEFVAVTLAASAESGWRRYEEASAAAIQYRDTIKPRSEQLLELAEEGYRAGQVSLTALLDARRAYIEERVLYLDTLRAYMKSAVDLERFVGRDLVYTSEAGE